MYLATSNLFALFLYSLHAVTVLANLDCSPDTFASILPKNTTVTLAAPITRFGAFSQNGVNISISESVTKEALPICVVQLNVQSSSNTSFNTGVLLPNGWNGRLMATGNPGFGGGLRWSFQASVLKYGAAVTISTDTGHVGAPNNISFAIDNPDGIIDWSYRSLHESTVLAKQLAKAFYGSDVEHSYYTACSNGGRQGLKEVQMFPNDYDGVLAGAPPWQITHLHPWAVQLGLWNLPANQSRHIPAWKFSIISDLIMGQCDAQDGLADQIIQDPYSCNFSSNMIMWKSAAGSLLYPGFPLSASASRYGAVSTAPSHFGLEYFYGFVENNTSWDWETFQGEKTVNYVNSLNTGDAAALSMDLSGFKANGGKLMMYHGLSDTTIPTGSSMQYFQGVHKTMGSIDDFFQLYLVPGMGHCGESEVAPYYIAAAGQIVKTAHGNGFSVPGYVDPEHDILLAMMRWVENGTKPEQLIATKWKNDTFEDGLVMQRPLCPYPQKAVYGGSDADDWHIPTSWSCQEGQLLSFPLQNGSLGTVKSVCVDNCTSSTGKGNGSTSNPGHKKNGAKSLEVMSGDGAWWGFLALLGLGYLL